MSDKDVIELEGIVEEILPNGMYRVKIKNGASTNTVLTYVSGKMRKFYIKIVVGDKVKVEFSPYDLSRGRITFREK